MTSNVFQAGSPTGTNMYDPAKQREALRKAQLQRGTPRQVQAAALPRARDCKVTDIYGHNVLAIGAAVKTLSKPKPEEGLPRSTLPTRVRFGDHGEPIEVVEARREGGDLPRDFWASQSGLEWTDLRGERVRTQDVKEASRKLDAAQRKMRELSSEVLGSLRRLQKSTASASREITSAPLLDICSEVSQREQRPLMDRQARMPLSARQNKSDSLAVSSGSQFCRPPGQLVRSASEDADPRRQAVMFRGKGVIIASEDRNGDGRRRSERNFSDLFGQSSGRPLPLSTAGRSEFHATATASWMDSTTETSARNHERRAGLAESGSLVFDPSAQSMEKILPLSPRGAAPRRSPDWFEERTCWDFSPQNAMHIGVELARRSREGPARRVQSLDAGRPGRGNIAPAERKQANLASRLTGASQPTAAGTPKGRARSAIADSPSMVRSGDLSPAARSALSLLTPNSARERKFKELHSSAKLI